MLEKIRDLSFKTHLYIDIFLILISLLSAFLILNHIEVKGDTARWIQVSCVIEEVKFFPDFNSDPPAWYWTIYYKYKYKGIEYRSDRYKVFEQYKHIDSDIMEQIEKTQNFEEFQPYEKGQKTICYVNPNNPEKAILVRGVGAYVYRIRLAYPALLFIFAIGDMIRQIILKLRYD